MTREQVTQPWPDAPPESVYNPPHYKQGKIECIEAIQSALTEEECKRSEK